MDQIAAKNAIKTILTNVANQATLLSGLVHQGENRKIIHVTTSILTPPTGYYYIAIESRLAVGASSSGATTIQLPPRKATHEMAVEVADYAVGQLGEDELFEKMHGDFTILCDRIVALIASLDFFPSATASPRFRLERSSEAANDRRISVENLPVSWKDAEDFHAILFANIEFSLQGC